MAKQPEYVDVTTYVVIAPEWGGNRDDQDRPILRGASVEKFTKTRPTTTRKGGIVTRITFRIDTAALLPLQPEAVIHIRAGEVDLLEVVAEDPRDGDETG